MKILIFLIGIIIIFLLLTPFVLTSSPARCAVCHEMKPYYDSWRSSFHATAARSCLDCHLEPGWKNKLIFALNYWREITGQKGAPSTIYYPATRSCTRSLCHSLNRLTSISGRIRINHLQHVSRLNIDCAVCHPGVVHAGTGAIGSWKPAVEFCFECHGSESLNCQKCHLKPPLDADYRHKSGE